MSLLSWFTKSTYRGICKKMIDSYKVVKNKNHDLTGRELYARALSLRPTWRRENDNSFTFYKDGRRFIIEEEDKFRDVVRNVIIFETIPPFSNQDYVVEVLKEISEVMSEEFKNFEE